MISLDVKIRGDVSGLVQEQVERAMRETPADAARRALKNELARQSDAIMRADKRTGA